MMLIGSWQYLRFFLDKLEHTYIHYCFRYIIWYLASTLSLARSLYYRSRSPPSRSPDRYSDKLDSRLPARATRVCSPRLTSSWKAQIYNRWDTRLARPLLFWTLDNNFTVRDLSRHQRGPWYYWESDVISSIISPLILDVLLCRQITPYHYPYIDGLLYVTI